MARAVARHLHPHSRAARPCRVRPWGLLLVLAAAAVALASPAAAAARNESGSAGRTAPVLGLRDAVVSTQGAASTAAQAVWGGRYTTPGGEPVTLQISDAYPIDQNFAQTWVNFLGSLVHGPELSAVTVRLAPNNEIRRGCGFGALACFSPDSSLIITPGTNPRAEVTAQSVLAHEYGHHVAASRENPPWRAVDYGTKRWASYMQVCRRVRERTLFPGAQNDPDLYRLNPGEGFAEAYRLLNERKLGLPESPWDVVSDTLYPDATALSLLEQDVVTPWTGNTTSTLSGAFRRTGPRVRTHGLATALDGTLELTVRAPASAQLRLELFTSSGTRAGQATVRGGSRLVRTTVCGSRSYRARVTKVTGAGSYRLTVSKP